MSVRTYIKLMFHVVITMLIVLSVPMTLCILLCNNVPDWITIVSSLASALITIFFGIKYVYYAEKSLFEDMF